MNHFKYEDASKEGMICPYCYPEGPNLHLDGPEEAVEGLVGMAEFTCGKCGRRSEYEITFEKDGTRYKLIGGAES